MYPGTYAKLTPDKPAVVHTGTGTSISYARLEENSIRLARYLHEAGLRPGDDLALLTDNDPRCFEVYWAAQRSGLYITAVNRYLSADEAAYILNDCGARALVIASKLGELAAALIPRTPVVRHRLSLGEPLPDHESYATALASVSAQPLADQPRGADMLYSSGTTGRPKGVKTPLPDRQVDEPGDQMVALFGTAYGFDQDSVYLSPAPIYHAAPLRFGGMVQALGGTVVLMPRFDAHAALATMAEHRVTHSQWVPTMFVRMLKLEESVRRAYDLSSHRVAIHAAAPCPVEVKQRMIDWWGPILQEYYSCTESNGATAISSADWLRKPGSVGRAIYGVIHICDDAGAEVPTGEVGTVYWAQETPPFNYHNDPDRTAQAQHPDHPKWTTVGDIGRLDADGYLFLTDRKAFMIISGGVSIYPQEVENCLALHPKVLDVAVIGVPDEEMGEAVKAVVRAEAGVLVGPELADELLGYVRDRIAHYKCPRSIDFTEQLPRTPTGKLVKGELRARYLPVANRPKQ
ncbi:MAG TPA: acyl-CoA synthetase [Pseudonocardiaceae bacterium]|jgi:fatty-acyl-CoA synthase|nr:acyl-CoA synthetase [Pseudonocardiaceae bacterium]